MMMIWWLLYWVFHLDLFCLPCSLLLLLLNWAPFLSSWSCEDVDDDDTINKVEHYTFELLTGLWAVFLLPPSLHCTVFEFRLVLCLCRQWDICICICICVCVCIQVGFVLVQTMRHLGADRRAEEGKLEAPDANCLTKYFDRMIHLQKHTDILHICLYNTFVTLSMLVVLLPSTPSLWCISNAFKQKIRSVNAENIDFSLNCETHTHWVMVFYDQTHPGKEWFSERRLI